MATWQEQFDASSDPLAAMRLWGQRPSDSVDMATGEAAQYTPPPAADPNQVTAGYVNANGSYTQPGNTYNGNNTPINPGDVNQWLDPSTDWTTTQGMRALNSSAAAGGQTFSGQTLKDILNYSQGQASTQWNNALTAAQNARQFTQQGSQFDRNLANQMGISENGLASSVQQANASRDIAGNQLAYTAAHNDQLDPMNLQLALAQMGLSATNGQTSGGLAGQGMVSNNTIAGGNAAGAGAVGSAANLNSIISTLLQSFGQNRVLNQVLPAGG